MRRNEVNMKKLVLLCGMVLLLILLVGCKKDDQNNNQNNEGNTAVITPTTVPIVTLPAEITPIVDPTTTENNNEELQSIKDYYPIQPDTEYIYEGAGNEYAAYVRYLDFMDLEANRLQTRTDNGGSVTVRVLEIKDGKLSIITTVNECYYRDNFMEATTPEEKAEVLLMEPLVKGTQWLLPDGQKRYISDTAMQIVTPLGSYKALEVTTEGNDSLTKDYYAYGIGLVKTIFISGDMEVASLLSEIHPAKAYTQVLDVNYPDTDEKIYVEPITLTFHTGDDTKTIIEETLKKQAKKDTYLPLASTNTKVNSLYLDKDGIVQVDFSPEFVNEMNAGAGYELLILQSITNTLGNYYGARAVSITLEGKPYESGHVLMKKGETFKVNMKAVVQK